MGEDLVLFEANARRVGAEPLVTGDPLEAATELTKLVVKKINQLGGCVHGLLSGEADLPGVDLTSIKRIWPVVVAAGHVWQTSNLWSYLERARDAEKCRSFYDPSVRPLQLLDADEYEMLLALTAHGNDLPKMLSRKTNGPYRHRDLAVWLAEDPMAPDKEVRLDTMSESFLEMTRGASELFRPGD